MSLDGGCPYSAERQEKQLKEEQLAKLNNMPVLSEQRDPQQTIALSTDREISTIPMAGIHEGKKWIYPSEQMFYNALKRKSYGAKEQDMPTVIPIHNVVNEMCWKKVLEWESLSFQSPEGPKLVKFEGKPTDYTIKARIRQFMGYSLPFDRHDWIVERNGKEIKYIIDFYGGDEGVKGDEVTSNNIGNPSIFLDVRPGLTFDGYVNRIRKYVRDGNGIF